MIYLKAGPNGVKLPTEWSDITLDVAQRATKVEPIQDTFRELDKVKKLVSIFSSIDIDTLNLIEPLHLEYFYVMYLAKFVNDLHEPAPQTYSPQLLTKFTHKGQNYLMPESLIVNEATIVLQHGQKVKNFVEASNMLKQIHELKANGIDQMPLFISSIVKTSADEIFNEQMVVARAKELADLPMDIVWEVFFCTSQLTLKLANATLQSIMETGKETGKLDMKLGRLRSRKAELWAELKQLTSSRSGTS